MRGEKTKPECGDSRHDLNYPEIPNSWNNKEKTKMANFSDRINLGTGFVLIDPEHNYFIYQEGSMEAFRQNVHNHLYFSESSYRLFIQYEDTYGVESIDGRCFMWSRDMAEPNNSFSWRSLDDRKEDLEGFGDPRFDHIEGAIFILDHFVYVYGDTWIKAVDLEEKHVVCKAYVCGRFVSKFRIPSKTFDRLFGLKENFPEQYEKVFGKTQDAKPVQEENDLIEEAKRNVELCKNSLYSTKQMIKRAVDLMQGAIIEIDDMLDKLT